jgi:hypothetical protein
MFQPTGSFGRSLTATLSFALVVMICAPGRSCLAQVGKQTTGTASGRVQKTGAGKGQECVKRRDGKGIAGAFVKIVNQDDNTSRGIETDANGCYSRPLLPPGQYELTARKFGFKPKTIRDFPVALGRTNPVKFPDFQLEEDPGARGEVKGKVTDVDGQALAEARVVATCGPAGVTRDAVTDSLGAYSLGDLPPGDYVVTALWTEGDSDIANHVSVALDREEVIAPTIRLGAAVNPGAGRTQQEPQQGERQGEQAAALVNAVSVSRGGDFAEKQLLALPLGGGAYMRSFDELALLIAGVAPPPYTPGARGPGVGFGVGTAGQFSVNGSRARSNNFSADGSDNNDADVGVRRQGFVALAPQAIESVKAVSVATLLWDAELGRNFGSQVNVVTGYGGQKFHGQAYAFHTGSELNARNFFDYTGGASGGEDPFRRTQAGLAIEGPITRERAHFFASAERQDVFASPEQHFATPTVAERRFLPGKPFGAPAFGVILPFNDATPLGRNLLELYPKPNHPGGPFGANTFTEALPADGKGTAHSLKVTRQLVAPKPDQVAPDHVFNGRYNLTDDQRFLPSVNRAINSTIESRTRSQNISLILDSALKPTLFNQARFSFGRTRLEFLQYPGSPFIFSRASPETTTVRLGPNAIPVTIGSETGPIGELVIEPFSPVGVGVFYFPQSRASNTFQYADSVSWSRGDHSFSAGGNVRRYQLNSLLDRLYRPQLIYGSGLQLEIGSGNNLIQTPISGVELASVGIPSAIMQTITAGPPNSGIGLRFTEYHFFLNDNWRFRPNLTLDYGLRYEYNTVPREVNNRIENALRLEGLPAPGASRFDSADRTRAFNESVAAYRRILDGRKSIYDPDHNNFGPHIGFAWTPETVGRTVVRGGYGIYHDTILGAVVSQSRNVFPTEIPINVDPSFGVFDTFNLNNPAFLQFSQLPGVPNQPPVFTNPTRLLRAGTCNRFNTCNQIGGSSADFAALIGALLLENPGGGLAFTLTEKRLRTPYAQHWHLTVEREGFSNYLFSAAYAGVKGVKLTRLTTPNLGPNVTPFIQLSADANGFRSINAQLTGGALPLRPEPKLGA